MMSKEKQIEEMASDICALDMDCKECHLFENNCHAKKYARRAYNAGYRKQSGWISVDERLPEPFEDVVVYDKINFICIDYIDSNNVWGHTLVTHWMPLPEAPKGGAE